MIESISDTGDGTHHQKQRSIACILKQKGEIPIAKNIHVVDEQGNQYESTYPKRANGLVKNGRARFISEDTICLTRPPDVDSEENSMAELTVEYSIPYILRQIAAIQADTAQMNLVVEKLAAMSDGDSGEPGSPGNIQGKAKAEALAGVIRLRETTYQQILRLYEKMYDDLTEKTS